MRVLLITMCALFAVLPCAAAHATEQPVSKAVLVDENMLARMSGEEKERTVKALGPVMDPSMFPEADEVAIAVDQALSEPAPKRRYLAIPRNAKDRINGRLAERLIRWQMKQVVQWNEGQPYTFDRETLIKMLDDALATARPRTE